MVTPKSRCVIVSASPVDEGRFIESRISDGDYIICADGGLDKLLKLGITPNLVVGDFDSLSNRAVLKDKSVLTLPHEKDDTDTMYCVKYALSQGFSEFLFLGAMGGRVDHMLSNLSLLLYLKNRNAHGVISDIYGDNKLLNKGENILNHLNGRTVSIIPFACESVELSYTGMYYPLKNAEVKTEYPFSISNIVISDTATVTLHKGTALLIIPTE